MRSTGIVFKCFIIPFFVIVAILMCLMAVLGFAPFGGNSFASMDANIQYLDFFSYFKDVPSGENEISYTFGKTLGGNNIAVFSYYLSSPLNLLVVFFSKENLNTFFDFLVVLKLGLAGSFCMVFLKRRFEGKTGDGMAVLLSVCYGLSQYCIAQSSNVMWLDGVYMLPLILLGIYDVVRGKSGVLLTASVGCAILFNWYSGAIDCLFAILWFFFELFFCHWHGWKCTLVKERVRKGLWVVLRCAFYMFLGVLIGLCLFLPTVLALQGGRANIDINPFAQIFTGNPLSAIPKYTIGGVSDFGKVSLFCGCLPLIACIGIFFSREISWKRKTWMGIMLAGMLLLFYFYPAYVLFSLIKTVTSYWYRYSYVGIFAILFVTAWFWATASRKDFARSAGIAAVLFAVALGLFQWKCPETEWKYVLATILFALAEAAICFCICRGNIRPRSVTGGALLLAGLVGAELIWNASYLMEYYAYRTVEAYRDYVAREEQTIDEIQKEDSGAYRITSTSSRETGDTNLTADYNEALAFGYASLSGYTSDPDENERTLLENLGYRKNGDNMCIVNTSNLSADSLLSVKYVLSNRQIRGLSAADALSVQGNKTVYENPYALPMAFVYSGNAISVSGEGNPFEYQNALYSALLGKNVELFVPVQWQEEADESTVRYILTVPDGNYSLYGNLCWNTETTAGGLLDVNGAYVTDYAGWCSPSVFDISYEDGSETAYVQLAKYGTVEITDVQFYALDLDALADVSETINARSADEIAVENGYASFTADGSEGESLYISIPYDSGWTVTRNGEKIGPSLVADCMLSIPLESGENVIEMTYRIPGLKAGIGCMAVGALLLMVAERKHQKRCYKNILSH